MKVEVIGKCPLISLIHHSNRNRAQRKTRPPTFFQFRLRIIEILVIISSFPAYNFSGYMFVNFWFSDTIFYELNHSNYLPSVHRDIVDWRLTYFDLAALEDIRYNVATFGTT